MNVALESVATPFELTMADGAVLRGEVNRPEGACRGRCVLVPPFGVSRLDLFMPAAYLLGNGFEVVLFDPTHHVGTSDGRIADFTLGRLCTDLVAVLDAHGGEHSSLVSISLSARSVLRVLADRTDVLAAVLLSPVVHTRRTLTEVCGRDILRYAEDADLASYTVLGFEMNRTFATDCRARELDDLDGTLADASRLPLPTSIVAGSTDRWVDFGEVEKVARAMPRGRLVPVEGANHQMFRSPVVMHAYMKLMLTELFAHHEVPGEPVMPAFHELVRRRPRSAPPPEAEAGTEDAAEAREAAGRG